MADSCPNAQFRVGPSASLPDCRAYEQVTPADKGLAQDIFVPFATAVGGATVSSDGSGVLLGDTFAEYPEAQNPNSSFQFDLFTRSSSGWQVTGVKPAGAPGGANYESGSEQPNFGSGIWSPDLSHVALADTPDTADAGVGLTWQVGPFGGPYQTISGPANQSNSPGGFVPPTQFLDATPDFSDVLLASTDHNLAPGATGTVSGASDVYEYDSGDGKSTLVNVTTGGSLVSPCGADLVPLSLTGYRNPGLSGVDKNSLANVVSSDGSKAFFLSPDPYAVFNGATDASCSQSPQLYMRDFATGTTVDVSAPQGITDPDGPQPVYYVGAAPDGSRVYFETTGELTPDDAGIHDLELYEYNTVTGVLTRVSHGSSGTAAADVGANANADAAVAMSSDGSTVYFESPAQLTPDAPATLPAGYDVNLYRYDADSNDTTYVATAADATSSASGYGTGPYTTPNGRFLLFESTHVLGSPANAGGFNQVYRYDSADGSVTCVSCRPDGTTSQSAGWSADGGQTDLLSIDTTPEYPANPISDDGQYVFFNSDDQLVPQDTNGISTTNNGISLGPGNDVYEWEANGTGGCATARGCVHLLSSGTDSVETAFVGASSDGSNVFIATHSQLVAQDTDQLGDIYDVRIDGGFPAPSSPAQCSGDGCQGVLSPSPSLPAAASVSFSGPGDTASRAHAVTARVITHTVRGDSFLVSVRVSGRGRVTLSGAGIRRVSRSVAKAGAYRLRVTLTSAMRRLLARRQKLSLMLAVSYAPPGASAETGRVRLSVERPVGHHAGHVRRAGIEQVGGVS